MAWQDPAQWEARQVFRIRRAAVRALVVPLAACAALLLLVAPVRAHNVLTGSDPKDGATLAAMPGRVTFTFDQPVRPDFARIAVTGPDGARYEQGEVGVQGTTVFIGVRSPAPPGAYSIGYRIVSNDGHPVTGTVNVTVTGDGSTAAPPSPTAPANAALPSAPVSTGGSGTWVWVLLVATAALLVLCTLVLVRHDRRQRSAA